eukprot:jgi/Picsp_1/6187/NSC_03541-R1_hypothetical protein CHLNCDRAFT_144926 [Chlorella variabilis]
MAPLRRTGSQGTGSQNYIEEEFRRLARRGRNHLVLKELLRFRTTGLLMPVDVCHLGVLWVLDRNHDGKVTLEELNQLERFCRDRGSQFQSFEMGAQLQALCTITLWQEVTQDDDGKDMFTNWITNLLIENSSERRRFWRHGAHQYIHMDTIEVLHQFLRIQEVLGLGFQGFFDLLQRVAEEQKLMDLDDEEQDHWVPILVVKEFISSTFYGAAKLMLDIFPAEEMAQVAVTT